MRIVGMITVLAGAGTLLRSAAAQKVSVPRSQDNLARGEDQVKQRLLLMPTDNNGMVTPQEYLKFMEAEFDRLDKERKGEQDARKLAQSNLLPAALSESNAQSVAATFKWPGRIKLAWFRVSTLASS